MRERDWTKLHLAAGAGDRERVEALLRAGADPGALAGVEQEAGRTALHCAVDPGLLMGRADDAARAAVVVALLDAGAPSDAPDVEGMTPLLLAARGGLRRCCELLLDAGAAVDAVDRDRCWTALHLTRSREVAALLLDRGADPDAAARFAYAVHDVTAGARLEFPAGSTPSDVAWVRGAAELVELLASRGGRRQTTAGRTDASRQAGLHEAIAERRVELATRLIDAGDSLETRDDRGRTPLLVAINVDALDLARLLVARGADLRACDADGATALHLAYSAPAIDWLVDVGLAIDARDRRGRTALHRQVGSVANVQALLAAGASPDVADASGRTPLAVLLADGMPNAVVQLLIDAGAKPDVDVPTGPRGHPTPATLALVQAWRLSRAESCGEGLAALLRGGADPDRADRKGWTALHEAAYRRMDRAIEMLRGAGARDDLPTTGRVATFPAGTTAADVARARGVTW